MRLVRFADAPTYTAPGHEGMAMKRLQGMEASDACFAWMGFNRIAPGGHTDLKASDSEKIYAVVDGIVEFSDGQSVITAERLDTVYFPRGASRQIRNTSDRNEAMVLLVMEAG